MSVISDFNNYQKHYPSYDAWSNEQDYKEGKKAAYLRKNPNAIKRDDVIRTQAILRSIDTMDEFSQEKAENTETATNFIKTIAMMVPTAAFMFLALKAPNGKAMTKISEWGKNLSEKFASSTLGAKFPEGKDFIKSQFPTLLTLGAALVATVPLSFWSTKKQTEASAKGRMEAMTKDLANPANFAVLTDQQMAQVDAIAQGIELKEDKKDGMGLMGSSLLGKLSGADMSAVKDLFEDDKKYQAQKAKFNQENYKDDINIQQNTPITKEQAEQAKKDQQILSTMIRKIDTASQDYAENVEFATNTLQTLAPVAGIALSAVAQKTKLFDKLNIKSNNPTINLITQLALPLIMSLGANVVATHLQKEASKVGKFKAKQEIMANPENFVYVDEKTLAKEKECDMKPKKKEKNIFSFLVQAFKDKKEYDQYKKTEGKMNKKRQIAMEQIQLSDAQMKEAKALQKNIFKSFNKVDEKSQRYAESVECVGENVQQVVQTASSLVMMAGSVAAVASKSPLKNMGITLAISALPQIVIDYFITKEQKKASRVADMQALKEMEDYRNFVDYSSSPQTSRKRLSLSA